MNPAEYVRTHVTLPRSLVACIDGAVGRRGRSRFLAEAARRELASSALAQRELIALAEGAIGSGEGLDRPWGDCLTSIAAWVDGLRGEDLGRDGEESAVKGSGAPV